jgi:hypothetical protein
MAPEVLLVLSQSASLNPSQIKIYLDHTVTAFFFRTHLYTTLKRNSTSPICGHFFRMFQYNFVSVLATISLEHRKPKFDEIH